MPLAYKLNIERGGSIVVETWVGNEDSPWLAGLMLHIDSYMAMACRDDSDPRDLTHKPFLQLEK